MLSRERLAQQRVKCSTSELLYIIVLRRKGEGARRAIHSERN